MIKRQKWDAGYSQSMAMRKVWRERKFGIRKWLCRKDSWKCDNEAFLMACKIQDYCSLDIGIVPYLHEAVVKYKRSLD